MAKFLAMILMLGAMGLFVAAAALAFVGLGYLGAHFFPLSLFQATLVGLGAACFVSLSLAVMLLIGEQKKLRRSQEGRRLLGKALRAGLPMAPPAEASPAVHQGAVARDRGGLLAAVSRKPDRLCPCGSGKRFSACCGN